jgi:hypothetical protein
MINPKQLTNMKKSKLQIPGSRESSNTKNQTHTAAARAWRLKAAPNAFGVVFGCSILVLLVAAPISQAQPTANPPGQISYQGFLTDANGIPLATNTPKNYTIVFRIWDASTGGSNIWAEQQVVTVDRGYFTVMLGVGTSYPGAPFTNNLSGLFSGSSASDRYIGITATDLSASEIAPRLRLLASPYSFLASTALSVAASGSVPDSSLSPNVALRAGGNNFTGVQTVTGGNVGIGTTTPETTLQVGNYSTSDQFMTVSTAGGNQFRSGLKLRHFNSSTGVTLVSDERDNTFRIISHFSDTNGITRLILNRYTGYVGIGTNAPDDTLHVNGIIQAIGFRCRQGTNGSVDFSHQFNFDWIANSQLHAYIDNVDIGVVSLTSDRRLKEDIQPLANDALDRVMALKPSSFKYKEVPGSIFHGDGQLNEGFIADELQQVIPSAVNGQKDALTRDGQIQPQTLNIIPVVSVLAKAMQEQQQTIQRQQRAMQELEARLEKLERLLEHNSNVTAR